MGQRAKDKGQGWNESKSCERLLYLFQLTLIVFSCKVSPTFGWASSFGKAKLQHKIGEGEWAKEQKIRVKDGMNPKVVRDFYICFSRL